MNLNLKPSTKAWLSVLFAVTLFNCSNCTGTCKPNVPYPQPGSCPIPGVATGQPGGKCPTWPNQCANDSHCINGTCLPCGGVGEACCGPMDDCTGSTCDQANDICRSDCGGVGEQCCGDGHCINGSVCDGNSNTCTSGPPACNGSTTWYIGLVDANRCAAPENIIVKANSAAEATTCANAMPSYGYTRLPPQTTPNVPTEYVGCLGDSNVLLGSRNSYFFAFSASDAAACLQSQCVNCQVTMGECPQE